MHCSIDESPLQNKTVYLTVDVNDVETLWSYVTDENGDAYFILNTTHWNDTLVSLRVSPVGRQKWNQCQNQ